jgi:hypothetical protein
MPIPNNECRTAIKAFFYSYLFKGCKYMNYILLNKISSPLLNIKPTNYDCLGERMNGKTGERVNVGSDLRVCPLTSESRFQQDLKDLQDFMKS